MAAICAENGTIHINIMSLPCTFYYCEDITGVAYSIDIVLIITSIHTN